MKMESIAHGDGFQLPQNKAQTSELGFEVYMYADATEGF